MTFDIGEYGKKTIEDTKKSSIIKRNLIKKRGRKCEGCDETKHRGKVIPLDLHRLNDNMTYKESSADNFRLLCPNCHRQTDSWGNTEGPGKISDTKFIKALSEEDNINKALGRLGINKRDGNHERAKKLIKKYDIEMAS